MFDERCKLIRMPDQANVGKRLPTRFHRNPIGKRRNDCIERTRELQVLKRVDTLHRLAGLKNYFFRRVAFKHALSSLLGQQTPPDSQPANVRDTFGNDDAG